MTTKQYLRFTPGTVFGVIASSTANILSLNALSQKSNFFAVPACENVYIWNLRTKEKHMILDGDKSTVTCLVADTGNRNIAVGYADGMVRLFDLRSGECTVSFIGHKTAVSCLTLENGGSNLVSGGKDSEIVIWNVTEEAGLFRLKGHKGPINKCLFTKGNSVLISSSMDTYIKFWDLETQHCFHTLVGSQYEILDITLIKGTRLISGTNRQSLKVWNLFFDKEDQDVSGVRNSKKLRSDLLGNQDSDVESDEGFDGDKLNEDEEENDIKFKTAELGIIPTEEQKTSAIIVDPSERIMGIHGSTKYLSLFKILNQAEINKKLRKRRKKELKRKSIDEGDDDQVETAASIEDEFQAFKPFQLEAKIHSFTISVNEKDIASITVLLKNNSIMQYKLDLSLKTNDLALCQSIMLPGHRSFVRTLACSSDGISILSACDTSIKIWRSFNEEQKCANTLECDSALCSIFVTGNSHCIIGTKKGELNIFDINTRELLESINAHEGAVKCICLNPDERGVTSGGSDKNVKFWNFELVKDSEDSDSKKRLSLTLGRTLQMPEEILCLKYSPDYKRIAIALLDNTVQVLFADSLKLAFSLYGHSLPVTCLDISYDNSLIVTGSSDRTIRIWSMEFGSCNKRLKIIDEKGTPTDKGITCLQFLPKTHLFFTGGKDHVVRQWDADNFQKITTLKGHQNEVIAMSVSPDGMYIVTSSKDRSVRTWEKTKEPLVLQEEQEIEAEERAKEIEDLPAIPGEVNQEVALPGIKTEETIKTVDKLIEALELYEAENLKLRDYELECKKSGQKLVPPPVHPVFMAYRTTSPIEYIRKALRKIKASELEGALLHLPFNYVLDFLKILSEFSDRGWETEFCEKCATFLVRIHFGQISTTRTFCPIIDNLKNKLFKQMYHVRDMVGFAKVVSNLQQRAIDAREEVSMFSGILDDLKKKRKARRRIERPVVAFS